MISIFFSFSFFKCLHPFDYHKAAAKKGCLWGHLEKKLSLKEKLWDLIVSSQIINKFKWKQGSACYVSSYHLQMFPDSSQLVRAVTLSSRGTPIQIISLHFILHVFGSPAIRPSNNKWIRWTVADTSQEHMHIQRLLELLKYRCRLMQGLVFSKHRSFITQQNILFLLKGWLVI